MGAYYGPALNYPHDEIEHLRRTNALMLDALREFVRTAHHTGPQTDQALIASDTALSAARSAIAAATSESL